MDGPELFDLWFCSVLFGLVGATLQLFDGANCDVAFVTDHPISFCSLLPSVVRFVHPFEQMVDFQPNEASCSVADFLVLFF